MYKPAKPDERHRVFENNSDPLVILEAIETGRSSIQAKLWVDQAVPRNLWRVLQEYWASCRFPGFLFARLGSDSQHISLFLRHGTDYRMADDLAMRLSEDIKAIWRWRPLSSQEHPATVI